MEIPIYIILGLFVGVLGGLFGIGGGVIIVPALLFVLTYLGYESDLLIHICVATSLGTIFFTALHLHLLTIKKGVLIGAFGANFPLVLLLVLILAQYYQYL